MKSFVAAAALLSLPAFANTYTCHALVGHMPYPDFSKSEAVTLRNPGDTLKIEALNYKFSVESILISADEELVLKIETQNGVSTSAIFKVGYDHPYLHLNNSGTSVQIQCWHSAQ